jgi:hypothetical protein
LRSSGAHRFDQHARPFRIRAKISGFRPRPGCRRQVENEVNPMHGLSKRCTIEEVAFNDGNVIGETTFIAFFSCKDTDLYVLTGKGFQEV